MKNAFICLLCYLIVSTSNAATITVDRQGNGDFLVIQDAVDAAASGDTILIGPGRYNEGQMVNTAGWEAFVRVLVSQEELTLMGSGPDVSIIGPTEPFSFSQDDHRGIETGPYFGNQMIRVSGLGFENMRHGIAGSSAPEMIISECRFDGNYLGVFAFSGPGLTVEDCDFSFIAEWGLLLYSNSMTSAHVSNCNFTMVDGPSIDRGAQFDITSDVQVRGCNFFGGDYGLTISAAAGSFDQIDSCSFSGQSIRGLTSYGNSVAITNCQFREQETGMYFIDSTTNVEILNTGFFDIGQVSIKFSDIGRLNVSNSILEKGERFVVWEEDGHCEKAGTKDLPILFMENNDWGTVDADSIASWIKVCDFEVDFIPFVGQPVSSERKTLGGIKSLYR